MSEITEAELAALRAYGPATQVNAGWITRAIYLVSQSCGGRREKGEVGRVLGEARHARAALPRLIAEIERLRGERAGEEPYGWVVMNRQGEFHSFFRDCAPMSKAHAADTAAVLGGTLFPLYTRPADSDAGMRAEVDLLKRARGYLQTWLDGDECDCPPEGHMCGRLELTCLVSEMNAALAAAATKGAT